MIHAAGSTDGDGHAARPAVDQRSMATRAPEPAAEAATRRMARIMKVSV